MESLSRSFGFLVLVIMGTILLVLHHAHAADPPKPTWSYDCVGPYERCSSVPVHMNWSAEAGNMRIYVAGRFLDPQGQATVWYIGEHFDEINWRRLREDKVNIVNIFLRGSENTSPQLRCDAASLGRWCIPTAECATQMSASDLSLYSIEAAARDVKWVLDTLGKDFKTNILIGEGIGAAVAMRYMKNSPSTSVAVMLLDPMHPLHYDAYTGLRGLDSAMNHLMNLCDADAVCSTRLGAEDGAWAYVKDVIQRAARDKSKLPCLQHLTEDKSKNGGDVLASVLARMLSSPSLNPLAPSSRELLSLIPSFLYRLERCSDPDVKAFKVFMDHLERPPQRCPSNVPLYFNWLANEFSAHKPNRSPAEWLQDARKQYTLTPPEDSLTLFHNFYESLSSRYSNVHDNKLVNTRGKLLTIISDVDPFFRQGESNALSAVYTGDNNKIRQPRGSWHLSGSWRLLFCVRENIKQYIRTMQWADESVCDPVNRDKGNDNSFVDFVDVDASKYYGIDDAWAYTKPNRRDDDDSDDSGGDEKKRQHPIKRFLKRFGVAILLVLVIAGLCMAAFKLYRRRQQGYEIVSDNFYDNLRV